MGNKRKYKL